MGAKVLFCFIEIPAIVKLCADSVMEEFFTDSAVTFGQVQFRKGPDRFGSYNILSFTQRIGQTSVFIPFGFTGFRIFISPAM